ncbi:major facilitator transporter [Candidatus Magnetoovum chiemensis]|nr:major facilitator transporter [Candidatus Magnetoovum chiemensis]
MSRYGKKSWIISWCLYDFANSSYSAVIASVVFPVYYVKVIVGNEAHLGDLWWGRAIGLSMAFVALTSPFIGGLSDYKNLRKPIFILYTGVSVIATALLSILEPRMAAAGFLLIVLANIGMEGSLVFYNSYLKDITSPDYTGRVSAWGFAFGYVGSFSALLVSLPLVKAESFDIIWVFVACFFITFSLPAFINLPSDQSLRKQNADRDHTVNPNQSMIGVAVYTVKTFINLFRQKNIRRFLLAFFIYEDGVNTVIVFSSIFAASTLGFQSEQLVYLFLLVQVTAFIGAVVMSKPIDLWGPKKVIVLALILWCLVSVGSYFTYSKTAFFVIAAVAGLGLGTVQAASRALFASFIPHGKEAEYFGVYSMLGKTSSILGPMVFGSLSAFFNSQRPAVLSLSVFFIIGLFLILSVKEVVCETNAELHNNQNRGD